ATNTISQPLVSVITTIDYDHTHVLGKSLAEIAREKAGIIKEGRPVFVGKVAREARDVLASVAKSKRSPIFFFEEDFFIEDSQSGFRVCFKEKTIDVSNLKIWGYQRDNVALSIAVATHLGLENEAISKGISS